jgi:two-component system sensor histidine kinase RegB
VVARWLVGLRWWSVGAQLTAMGVAQWVFGIEMATALLLSAAAVIAATNAALAWWLRSHRVVPASGLVGAVLAFDVVVVTVMLAGSGGAHNPFSVAYLVYVTLAATALPAAATWGVVALSSVGYGALFVIDSGMWFGAKGQGHCPQCAASGLTLHLQGMWVAFVVASSLVAHFVGRVSAALRRRTDELLRVSALAARNERLAAMTTLAAGAAHELATPVGTIALVARELHLAASRAAADAETLDDLELIEREAARCRAILDRMAARSLSPAAEPPVSLTVSGLWQAVQRELPEATARRLRLEASEPGMQLWVRDRLLVQVLTSIVQNAADASPPSAPISLVCAAHKGEVRFEVRDEGHGMTPEVLARVGEPFFTTKEPGRGMGLGLFLAHVFADRAGGRLAVESTVGEGTRVTLVLPQAGLGPAPHSPRAHTDSPAAAWAKPGAA